MGCFNIAGFYTNQVIVYGNPVVGFLCCEFDVVDKSGSHSRVDHYSIPLSMPIFGTYNDYGSIENIEDSKAVDAIEEFFGYDIQDIVDDVVTFQVDQWLSGRSGRYEQIKKLRAQDPNEDFMKEEYDRYIPKYEQIMDLVTTTKSGSGCHISEIVEAIRDGRHLSVGSEKLEKENFNIFFAIDHAALWKAFIIKDEYSSPWKEDEALQFIKNTCHSQVSRYMNFSTIDELEAYVLHVCAEPSMVCDFATFISNITNNLEFKFKMPVNFSQDGLYTQYRKLNQMILKDTKE